LGPAAALGVLLPMPGYGVGGDKGMRKHIHTEACLPAIERLVLSVEASELLGGFLLSELVAWHAFNLGCGDRRESETDQLSSMA
jgi:hypothetical protein